MTCINPTSLGTLPTKKTDIKNNALNVKNKSEKLDQQKM